MDDFRVDSTSALDPYRDREHYGGREKKGKRPPASAAEDEYVASSGQAEDPGDLAADYYSPSRGNEPAE